MFRRLDAKRGAVRWQTNVRGKAEKYFFHGDMFVTDDRIVASSDVDASSGAEAGLHAFDRESGRELWKYRAGRGVLGAVAGDGKRVFAYVTNGDLAAVDLDSGKPAWTLPLKTPGWESPAVAAGRVFASSTDGTVHAIDAATGARQWTRTLPAPVSTSIRAVDSDVYVGTADGTLHRLDARTGEVRSSLKLDSTLAPSSLPIASGGELFVLLADQKADYRAVVAVDRTLNRIMWKQVAADRWSTSRGFVWRRAIWTGTPDGQLTGYCAADGTRAWSTKLSTAAIRSIGGSADLLYAGTPQGTLYAVWAEVPCR
jgi:outer membrane protein assembly factor BamB